MTGPSAAFSTFEQKWLAAHPENAYVALFLPPALRQRASAFGTLVHELSEAAFHLPEAQVAATKLAWWQQELADAAAGRARHPVTLALFVGSTSGKAEMWSALADAALLQLDDSPAASLAMLMERMRPFHGAVARAEAALFTPDEPFIPDDAALWTVSHLLREMAVAADDTRPIPLDLLARHGIRRDELRTPGSARTALVCDYLRTLQQVLQDERPARTSSLARRVRRRLDERLLRRAQAAADPLRFLQLNTPAGRWESLWVAWREARAGARPAGDERQA